MAAVSMTGPAQDGHRFLMACLLGLGLGLVYGFLRPLRRKRPILADLLFLPVMGYAWLYLGFAVCRGDLRLGYCIGLPLGAILWELTVGRLLRPVFDLFWRVIFRICRGISRIFKKFFKKMQKFLKILFAIWKKCYTIVWTTRSFTPRRIGGAPFGKKE